MLSVNAREEDKVEKEVLQFFVAATWGAFGGEGAIASEGSTFRGGWVKASSSSAGITSV